MPTPVSIARQCLTPEAAHALDEAVLVARRRGHGQTTSLHAVSALLSIPSSPLREACARGRNSTYSHRLQFKALDLCLSVSLDRVPSSSTTQQVGGSGGEPPVSNSLMAAIRRSQANQRRQPENFHLYQQIQQNQSSVSCVKVEIQHLILSILDDPIVSRVFAESGFRSSDIKLAVLRPLPQVFKYSRTRIPPLFLCNLTENPDRSFSFPFAGYTEHITGNENCRRIGEVFVRSKGRNPLLVGVNAYDALQKFTQTLQINKYNVLPVELSGLNIICIENEVSRFLLNKCDEGSFNLKLDEVGKMAEHSFGTGLVINIGDLKTLSCGETYGDSLNCVVSRLTRLLEIHGRKLWLIGAVASYEMYLNLLTKFPSIEKDWDSQLLPITSMKPSYAEPYSRSSLMGSFVPFAGFFSTPSEIKCPYSGSHECVSRCTTCSDKCEQEVTALSKDMPTASVVDQHQSNLPSWLQMAELAKNKDFDVEKAKDDGVLLSAKVKALQKKWDNVCNRLHHPQLLPKATSCQVGSQFQTVTGFQFIKDSKETADNCSSSNTYASQNGSVGKDLEIISTSKQDVQFTEVYKAKKESLMFKIFEKPSEAEDCHTSTDSLTSVTTDLDLHMFSSSSSSPDFLRKIDSTNAKLLFKSLTEKIDWQEEAVSLISQTIAHCRTSNEKRHGYNSRGDIWLNFLGPDTFGKKKVAAALAEVLFGGKEHFINIDFSSQNGMMDTNLFYVKKFRGKTAVDYIADELGKKKLSVIYLENVEKADVVAQNSLSHAIKTGKFSDSHGREVSINNSIFVTTSNFTDDSAKHFEDMIFKVKNRPIQISLKCDFTVMNGISSSSILVNKRKMMTGKIENFERLKASEIAKRAHKSSNLCLDLNNLPTEAHETTDHENIESEAWLEDFFNRVDKTVTFKAFDFDALGGKILNLIRESFNKINGTDYMLEIDAKVVDQIVAAYCLSDNTKIVENWVELVLGRGFEEARRKYNLTTQSALKLVASDDPFSDEQAPYLPHRIILN